MIYLYIVYFMPLAFKFQSSVLSPHVHFPGDRFTNLHLNLKVVGVPNKTQKSLT